MNDTVAVTLEQQIASVAREVALREACYPKWVANGRMPQTRAEHELRAMRAVLITLKALQENPTNASI